MRGNTVLHRSLPIEMDRAVRGNLNHLFQDEDAQAKMVRLGTSIVKHAIEEGLNGYKIVARSLRFLNGSDETEVDVKALRADVRRLEKEFKEYKKEVAELQVEVKALAADQLRLEKQLCEYRINKASADLNIRSCFLYVIVFSLCFCISFGWDA
ncbi:uncharacterized protein LOC103934425 isoform X2 [Pyrus x bretschneideri]|uniref:uncharacterized protein LOC103934425 isoform X2 n=1 Tax=Pyrus x bretschneideri TaxID=225117 RepID=UPI002030A9EA|nr:uncharacterized protein LOC103934425 isoform X2 [Pyrus x bretschneideri]